MLPSGYPACKAPDAHFVHFVHFVHFFFRGPGPQIRYPSALFQAVSVEVRAPLRTPCTHQCYPQATPPARPPMYTLFTLLTLYTSFSGAPTPKYATQAPSPNLFMLGFGNLSRRDAPPKLPSSYSSSYPGHVVHFAHLFHFAHFFSKGPGPQICYPSALPKPVYVEVWKSLAARCTPNATLKLPPRPPTAKRACWRLWELEVGGLVGTGAFHWIQNLEE